MDIIEIVVIFLLGSAAGLLIGWFIAKSKFVSESRAKTASLTETIQNKISESAELKASLNQASLELKTINSDFLTVSKELSAATTRLEQMKSLEQSLKERMDEIGGLHTTIGDLKKRQAELETILDKERLATQEKVATLEDIRKNLTDSFKAISAGALRENNQSFLDLARTTLTKYIETARTDLEHKEKEVKNIVQPVKDTLERYDQHIQAMERAREKAYGGLSEQVHSLVKTQQDLQKETGQLVKALRLPHVRGRWGEITLKRVAELSGMQNHCDFFEQLSAHTENGILRPDMIVSLPGGRQIIVDAKVPLSAYIDALEAETEEDRKKHLESHARHVQTHIQKLSQKTYWAQFKPTPEFVVLFIPGENFFSAALVQNPQLIEDGINKGVVLATPTTLISLLKAVSYGWNQETAAENARAISDLGKELYERLSTMSQHMNNLGRDIEKCVSTYNKVIGSFELRVLASARKFNELGLTLKENNTLSPINPVESQTRKIEIDENH